MDEDDPFAPAKKKPEAKIDFEEMSIEALTERIGELEREIAEIRQVIERKKVARGAADSVFRSKS